MHFAHPFLQRVKSSRRVLLTGPEGPDGDSFGACLALQRALAVAAPGVEVVVAGEAGFRYDWMPGALALVADDAHGTNFDGVVVLDGDAHRLLPGARAAFKAAQWTGIIDHHRSTSTDGYTAPWVDPKVESTCVMVRDLFREWGVPLTADVATQLYTGIIFDTGAFRYSNTKAGTHALAAELLAFEIEHHRICERVLMDRRLPGMRLYARVLDQAKFIANNRIAIGVYTLALADEFGTGEGDTEGIIDGLQHVQGVELSALFIEKKDKTKLSLRSRGRVDVSALAVQISPRGGGHVKAAGAAMSESVGHAVARVEPMLVAALAAANAE